MANLLEQPLVAVGLGGVIAYALLVIILAALAYSIARLGFTRQHVYALVGLAVLWPMLQPWGLPITVSDSVRKVYDKVESLPARSPVVISFDYDPASEAELQPMAIALLRHCFQKDLRVVGLTLWPNGAGLADAALRLAAEESRKKRGEDWAFLGFKTGTVSVIIGMGANIRDTFPKDFYGDPTADMPIFRGFTGMNQGRLMVDLAAGASIGWWITYGQEKFGYPIGAGCTAVSATEYYPFINSGQLVGLVGGMKGAAEYEALVNKADRATKAMDAQSAVHFLIIALVIVANVGYLRTRRAKEARP